MLIDKILEKNSSEFVAEAKKQLNEKKNEIYQILKEEIKTEYFSSL